ncbi:hypothetical protein ACIPY3_02710 [Paenarthrobacter sp. NPDC089714]|uniref:hypothetical protein n=1 Tax=Paenarthrobacter sp. NPDC089714 TaxID=3364377 RepID=UPI003804DF7F
MEYPKPVDPAEAAPLLDALLENEEYGIYYSAATRRDILRRAAYDMGLLNRQAPPALLPEIAQDAAARIREEVEPHLQEVFKNELRDELELAGWTVNPSTTWFTKEQAPGLLNSFSLALTVESVKIEACRPNSIVELLSFDRAKTSPERLARVLAAVFA